jgi:hypothetical protein
MAKTTFTRTGYIADDASFRSLGKAISDALTAVGMVQTSDTGQINWTTITKPTTSSTIAGYEVWRFADSSNQTSCPVFLKIQYGTGSSSTSFGLTITLCHATDGAGTVNGEAITYTSITNTVGTTTDRNMCFVSSDSGASRLAVMLFVGGSYTNSASGSDLMVFTIDRLRDADGTANATGTHFIGTQNNSGAGQKWSQSFLPASATRFPTTPLSKPMCMMPGSCLNSLYPPRTGKRPCISYVYPYLGYCGNPDMNVFVYPNNTNYAGQGMAVSMSFYGGEHTFILSGQAVMAGVNGDGDGDVGIGVIYE